MNKEDITRMAREAGFIWKDGLNGEGYHINCFNDIERFFNAAYVAGADARCKKAACTQSEQEPTYTSTQATNCAGCGQHKHTPLRIDAMGGYVCLTCIDKKLGSLLGEFGYEQPEHSPDCALLKIPARDCDCRTEQEPVYPWFMKWNKCADFWSHYMCISAQAQEERAYEAKRWIERMRQAAELQAGTQEPAYRCKLYSSVPVEKVSAPVDYYTTPQPSKTWVEITPEELMEFANQQVSPKAFAAGAAWANAKLQEKNK